MEALGKKRRQRSASDVFNGGVVRLHGRCRHLLNILASVYHRLLHVGIVPTQFNKDARYYPGVWVKWAGDDSIHGL